MNHFLIRFWCVMKSGFYMTTGKTSSVVRTKEAPKHFPKPNLYQKKSWSATVWWSAAVWSITVLWNLVKPFHLRSMLSKSVRCTENCNACSWYWSTEWAQFSMTMPNHTSHNQCFKSLNELGHKVLPNLPYSPDLLPTDYHFFKHLDNILQGKRFHNQQEAENAFQKFIEFRSTDFYVTGINKHISHWQKICWL